MKDIANQLVMSWARKGPNHVILATDDFTRLTLDTIALCTMDFRFNSFYQDAMHPFVDAMLGTLTENGLRASRPGILTKMMVLRNKEYEANRNTLRETGLGIIENRRANPVEKNDVLNALIYGKDPKTGQVMRDELIAEQMKTFLIAGESIVTVPSMY
jgi:cytochrome P450 / NADPH-cytochrome P450 reductase